MRRRRLQRTDIEAAVLPYANQDDVAALFLDGTRDDTPLIAVHEVPRPKSACVVLLGAEPTAQPRIARPD